MRHGLWPACGGGNSRSAPATTWRAAAAGVVVAVLVIGSACRERPTARARPPAPAADFLLAAGDSTFWVTTGTQGIRVRGSPLLLAHYDGRYYELYVADEDHSFYDAVFTTQRIYRRDLLTGDSVVVFRDTTVAAAARGYAVAHPSEAPLAPDQDADEDPITSLTGEVDIVDVDGPFLSYEYRGASSAKRARATAPGESSGDAAERDIVRRGVLDLRVGKRASLRNLFGPVPAETAMARGRRAFAAAIDSVQAARAAGDERARRAAVAIREFTFDPLSFSVIDIDRGPAVQFFAPGTGAQGGGLALPLGPIRIGKEASVPWWDAELAALPVAGTDSASDVWARPGLEVIARYDTAGDPTQGQGVVLLERNPATSGRIDARHREWRVGRFPAPTRRIYWLDAPPIDTVTRRALVRAFDESALYGEDARSVRRSMPPSRRGTERVVLVARAPAASHRRTRVRRAHGRTNS